MHLRVMDEVCFCEMFCERNQNRIESVAEKCKGSIPMCAYEAMLNWDVRLAMCS